MTSSSLHVSIKGPAFSTRKANEVVKTAVANWLQKKYCTLLKPPPQQLLVLVDQGTQCDSLAAPSSAEQLKLGHEQLQREVRLAKKAFFLPDQDSDSDSDSAWDSVGDTEV